MADDIEKLERDLRTVRESSQNNFCDLATLLLTSAQTSADRRKPGRPWAHRKRDPRKN